MAERHDPDRYFCPGDPSFDAAKFAEQDFLIRSGMCPNGHGLTEDTNFGQRCPRCGFFTNTKAERERPQ